MSEDNRRICDYIDTLVSDLDSARAAVVNLKKRVFDLKSAAHEDRLEFGRFQATVIRHSGPYPGYAREETNDEFADQESRRPIQYHADSHAVVRNRHPYQHIPARRATTSALACLTSTSKPAHKASRTSTTATARKLAAPTATARKLAAPYKRTSTSPPSAGLSEVSSPDSSADTCSVRSATPPPAIGSLVYVIGGKKITGLRDIVHKVVDHSGTTFSLVRTADNPRETPQKRKHTSLKLVDPDDPENTPKKRKALPITDID